MGSEVSLLMGFQYCKSDYLGMQLRINFIHSDIYHRVGVSEAVIETCTGMCPNIPRGTV